MDRYLLPYLTADGHQAFLNLNLIQSFVEFTDSEGNAKIAAWAIRFQGDVPSQSWSWSEKAQPTEFAMLKQWIAETRVSE